MGDKAMPVILVTMTEVVSYEVEIEIDGPVNDETVAQAAEAAFLQGDARAVAVCRREMESWEVVRASEPETLTGP
jgi:hypothetical protein